MNDSSDIIKFVVIALVVIIIGYFFLSFFTAGPSTVNKYDGEKLVESLDKTGDDDSYYVIDNINFNLDSYEPKDELEAMLIGSMKRGRRTKAASIRLKKSMNNIRNDGRFFGKYFRKAKFYFNKGEYEKAIRVLVKLLGKNIKSPVSKSRAYRMLATCYAELGIEKQYYKALMRFYEIEIEMSMTDDDKKKNRLLMLKMQQKMSLSN